MNDGGAGVLVEGLPSNASPDLSTSLYVRARNAKPRCFWSARRIGGLSVRGSRFSFDQNRGR